MILLLSVVAYLAVTIGLGVYAARRVRTSNDFLLAGRSNPLYVTAGTLFATWFAAESLLGPTGAVARDGLVGATADMAAALALVLIGFFFARPLYRRGVITISDFFRDRFGPRMELASAVLSVLNYLPWIAAQMVGLGLALHLVTGLGTGEAMLVGATIVVGYTVVGGMWAITLTDFFQMIVLVGGLAVAAAVIVGGAGGLGSVLSSAPPDAYRLAPEGGFVGWLNWCAIWLAIGVGFIPSPDAFQRLGSAKDEDTAAHGAVIAGVLYALVALIPMLLALVALERLPDAATGDSEGVLLRLILQETGPVVQALFFGALLAAIMSSASSALLAPATIVSENLLRPRLARPLTDGGLLWATRIAVLVIAALALLLAVLVVSVRELLLLSAVAGLVAGIVPLAAGLWMKRAGEVAALASFAGGLLYWGLATWRDTAIDPALYGFVGAVAGLLVGVGLAPRRQARGRARDLPRRKPSAATWTATEQPPRPNIDIMNGVLLAR